MKLINNSTDIDKLTDIFHELNIKNDDAIIDLCNKFDKIIIDDINIELINEKTNKNIIIVRIRKCSLEYKKNNNNINWIY
jgi:hypothetical protein